MFHRRNRVVSALVIGSLALTLAACDSDGNDSQPTSGEGPLIADNQMVGAMTAYKAGMTFTATEPVEFGLLYREHPNYPNQDDWLFYTALQSDQNVTFNETMANLSDWDDRKALLIGAGDAPEIIPVTYPGQEAAFVAGGALLAVSDYVEYMPNFQQKIKDWDLEPYLDTLRQEDGKYYLLPGVLENVRPDYTLGFRTDVLDELGLDMPKTWADLHDVLVKVKKAYPDSYPLSDEFKGNALLNVAASSFGTSAGWGYLDGMTWNTDTKAFEYTGATSEYKSLIEYLHSLVADGLLDPESFTQEDDQAVQKLINEKSFGMIVNEQLVSKYRTQLDDALGAGTYQFTKLRVPSGPAGDVIEGSRLESGLMLSSKAAKSDHFMALLQFIDWLYYSDEGLEFSKWGVKGETYNVGSDGKRELAAGIDYKGLNPNGGDKNLQIDYGFGNGVFLEAQGSTTELIQSMLSDEEVAWQNDMFAKKETPIDPPWPLSQTEREQMSLYQTALKDHVDQNTLAFILGQRDLSEWDSYVSELKAKNMDQYVQVANDAQKRYAENNA